jgi:hypothetical protein
MKTELDIAIERAAKAESELEKWRNVFVDIPKNEGGMVRTPEEARTYIQFVIEVAADEKIKRLKLESKYEGSPV